jgi:hypothetical protein
VRLRQPLAVLAAAVIPIAIAAPASAAVSHNTAHTTSHTAAYPGTPAGQCSAAYFDADLRLGPAHLPRTGVVGRQLIGYRRTGGVSVQSFLATFWNTALSSWRYPPDSGYVIAGDGQPIEFRDRLRTGSEIDRYGSVYGAFLSPAGAAYASRSLPPQNLDGSPAGGCNYHLYLVTKSFWVDAGPIAPWFDQPGYGFQYQLNPALIPGKPDTLNVLWLLDHGYLEALAAG